MVPVVFWIASALIAGHLLYVVSLREVRVCTYLEDHQGRPISVCRWMTEDEAP